MAEATNPIPTASNPRVGEDGLGDGRAICEALGFDPTNHHNAERCPYCNPKGWTLQPSPEAGAGGDLGAWIEDRLSCAQGYIDLCADNGTDNPYQNGRVSLLRELQVLLASTGSGKEETKGADLTGYAEFTPISVRSSTGNPCGTDTCIVGHECPDSRWGGRCAHRIAKRVAALGIEAAVPPEPQGPAEGESPARRAMPEPLPDSRSENTGGRPR
jgi:hypothetical protein